jgi:hypothetical protein
MRRGQSEIIYLVISIGIAFIIAVGVFAFSKSFQADLNEQLANAGLERTAAQLESGFLKLKEISDTTNEQNASIKLQIPNKIGEQQYMISGFNNNVIELRTVGNPSILKLLTIKFWNVTINGFVDSQQGYVELELRNATSVLLK